MTRYPDDQPVTRADFEALFVGEPASPDPAADLGRGRRLRRRRRLTGAAIALAAVVTVGGTLGAGVLDQRGPAGPMARPSAVPSPPGVAPGPDRSTPTSAPSPNRTSAPRDTAPALRRDARGNYLDSDGRRLGGSIMEQPHSSVPAFHATTRNSWKLAARHLDPSGDHLADYDRFAFTGGGSGGNGLEVGQKLGWTVHGDRGEGMVQLAVTRLGPGTRPRLGPGRSDAEGFCNDTAPSGTSCRRTTVGGIEVYLGKTPDGGFVMDRLQVDGEVASIIVSPLFGNNTGVALRTMDIAPRTAAALLDDPALDVIG